MHFLGRWFVTAVATAVAIWLVPGISVVGGAYAGPIFTALVLALINMTIKPVMQVLSLPLTFLTLGIFALVVNALMLELASWFARNVFHAGILIDGFGAAFFGAIIVSVVTAILGSVTGL